jgi:Xaa-Pro aminopeptidase
MDTVKRINKIRQCFIEKGIDGLMVSTPENRFYLSGFFGSDGYLFITERKKILAVDFRYIEEGKNKAPEFEIFQVTGKPDWFIQLTETLNIRRLGFEADNVTYSLYRQFTETIQKNGSSLQLIPTNGMIDSLRSIKETGEIELIQKAVNISDKAIDHIKKIVHPGMTELKVAWEIEKFMRENGSEAMPFELIVGAGPNGALPHAHPSERSIEEGEPVVVDIGARYGNYTSDITRTIYFGKLDDTFRKVYDIVLGAQLSAMSIIKEGMTGEEADNIARIFIQETGYGEYFGHSLGHGVGLATHESPRLGMRSIDNLVNGMVFTIEPGIYLPGRGGVRIEDTVIIEDGKVKSLSHADK